jgi:hypothetical protein
MDWLTHQYRRILGWIFDPSHATRPVGRWAHGYALLGTGVVSLVAIGAGFALNYLVFHGLVGLVKSEIRTTLLAEVVCGKKPLDPRLLELAQVLAK